MHFVNCIKLIIFLSVFGSSSAYKLKTTFNLFPIKNYNLLLQLNCSILSKQSFEVFKPDLNDVNLNDFEFSLTNDFKSDDEFEFPFQLKNFTILFVKTHKSIVDVKKSYRIKLIATSKNNSNLTDESYINFNVNKSSINCLNDRILTNDYNQIKILFADSLFSHFSQLIFDSEIKTNRKLNYSVNLSENTQIDSFICYILIKSSSSQLNINGDGREKFRLELVDYGSTSFISASSSNQNLDEQAKIISPLISLYSLKLANKLDRETQDSYDLKISLANQDETFIHLNVIVTDVNDNEPKFDKLEYKFNTAENNLKNNCIGFIKANDPDFELNGKIKYSILNSSLEYFKEIDVKLEQDLTPSSTINDLFSLNELTGQICVLASLDRECYSRYTFVVVAHDLGHPISLKSQQPALVVVDVLDINDNEPIFFEQTSNNYNIGQKCLFNNSTQAVFLNNTNLKQDDILNYPQFYIEEKVAPNTFIAWIKAFDLDSSSNSQIDYYLEIINSEHQIFNTQNYYEDHFFTIDSNGIIRSMVSFNILDKENSIKTDSIEIDDSKVWIHKRSFLIKIIAKDRGQPSLLNEIFINIKIISQKEKRNLNLSLIPNKTTLWIDRDLPRIYETPLIRIKVNETATKSEISNSNRKFVYQLIPFIDDLRKEKLTDEDLEYSKNCSQSDIIKYFSLNKNGEIFLKNNIKSNISSYMICFVNVRVIDLSNLYHLYSNIEFTFIIYDGSNNSLESILLREKLIKKVNSFKKKFQILFKTSKSSKMITVGGGTGFDQFAPIIDQEYSNNQTLAFKLKHVFGQNNFNLNFYLFITSVGLLIAVFLLIIFNKIFIKRTKLLDLFQNQLTNKSFSNFLIKSVKLVIDIGDKKSTSKTGSIENVTSSNSCDDNNSNAASDNTSTTISKQNKEDDSSNEKKESFIQKVGRCFADSNKNKFEKSSNIGEKPTSISNISTRDSSNSLEIKDELKDLSMYSLKRQELDQTNNSKLFSNQSPTFDTISKSSKLLINNYDIRDNTNLDFLLNANIEEIESAKSSLKSFLIKEEILNLNNPKCLLDSNKMISGGGIYQVANQILIDYDDNTTFEMNNAAAKKQKDLEDRLNVIVSINETTYNIDSNIQQTKSILKTDKTRSNSNNINNENKDSISNTTEQPLERFEKIYYQNPLTIFNTPNQTNQSNQKKNFSNIGSFV